MANDADAASKEGHVYYPRAKVLWADAGITDNPVPATEKTEWLLSIECQKSRFYTADTFKCVFALFGDPAWSYRFWGNLTKMQVDIQLAFDEATDTGRSEFIPFTSVFRGTVDKVEQDAVQGLVTISGRNYAGPLIDSLAVASFPEGNIKDVLTDYANSHGLTPDIDGEFDRTFGREHNDEKSHQASGALSRQIREVDMVAKLVDSVPGGHHWVEGDVFHAHVYPEGDTWTINVPDPEFRAGSARHNPGNFTDLKFIHNLAFTQSQQVRGIWEHAQKAEGEVYLYPPNPEGVPADVVPENTSRHDIVVQGNNIDDFHDQVEASYHDYISQEWMVDWETSDPSLIFMKREDILWVNCTDGFGNGGKYLVYSFEFMLDVRRGFRCLVHGRIGHDDFADTPEPALTGGAGP